MMTLANVQEARWYSLSAIVDLLLLPISELFKDVRRV